MRVILVLILVLALTTLCAQDVAAAEDGPPTLRAAQFLRVEAASEAELEDTIFQLRSQGVDTLIVRMFQNVGERRHVLAPDAPVTGVYFSSKRAPVVMDLLGSVIRVARSLGMRVFAWMPTCTCDWAVTEHPEWRDYAYDPVSGVIQPIPRLDPFHPEVQAYLEELYKEVAAHEIDGILIQDDLISRYNQGLSPYARQLYLEQRRWLPTPPALYREIEVGDGGRPTRVVYTAEFWDWVRWKNENLVELGARLIDAARRVRPGVKFAINLYYETITAPENALAWYAQSVESLQGCPFDYYAVMAYHRQMASELRFSPGATVLYVSDLARRVLASVRHPSMVLVKVQVVDWETGAEIGDGELEEVLGAVSRAGKVSLGYVPAGGPKVPNAIQKYFRLGR